MQRAVAYRHSPLLSCQGSDFSSSKGIQRDRRSKERGVVSRQCSVFSRQPVKRAGSRRDNLCLAGVLSVAKPPERLPPVDCFPTGNPQPCSMMIPIGNEPNCLPSVGIATLNRRLKIDDALRATIDAISRQISVFSCQRVAVGAAGRQPARRAGSRRDNPCLAGVLSAAKPPERLHPGDCFPIGNPQPCSMMIPVGNEQNGLPSVGIATLNRRLKIDDALRATIDAVSCQISVFSCRA